MTHDGNLASDLLWGAGEIAKELFGKNTKQTRRRVYYLHGRGQLPTWNGPDSPETKSRQIIISSRSKLQQHFEQLIQASACSDAA